MEIKPEIDHQEEMMKLGNYIKRLLEKNKFWLNSDIYYDVCDNVEFQEFFQIP